jgi:hypothetical protein
VAGSVAEVNKGIESGRCNTAVGMGAMDSGTEATVAVLLVLALVVETAVAMVVVVCGWVWA